jgi:hypothetical protein
MAFRLYFGHQRVIESFEHWVTQFKKVYVDSLAI